MTVQYTHRITAAGDSCRLLAACFYEPDKTLLLEQKVCENLAMLLQGLAPAAAEAAVKMSESLASVDQDRLVLDYATLFVGPFELLAPPYGSIYLEKKRAVMGESTIAVAKFYRDAGLRVEAQEPPDHIAIELEFLSFLHSAEAGALAGAESADAEKYRDLRSTFLNTYLQPWVQDFGAAIRSGTANPFYLSLADCLSGFMAAQQQ